ncbi:hypothetical protein GQ600_16639 [Phytophthora cactorum]|nr:hypothetical protein GQ600_16639 [Phytophthora cactorum]
MIDAVLELYNKDSAMNMFIVADNCATNQAIATRLGVPQSKPIFAGGLSIAVPAHLNWRGTLARNISPSDSHQLLNRCGIRTLA